MVETNETLSRVGFGALLAMALGYALWPWATATLVPSMDFPSHLALVEVMHGLSEPGSLIARKFTWGFFPAPNSMFYLVTYALSLALGTMLAGRVVFVAAMALQVLAFGAFARTFGRSRWVVFAAIPLVAQWTLTEGFLDYYIGVAFLFLAISAQHRYLQRPTTARAWAAGALGVCVFLAHVQAFLFFGLWSAVLLVLHGVRNRYFVAPLRWPQVLRRVAVLWGPCLLLASIWVGRALTTVGQSTWNSKIRIIFEGLDKRVFHLLRHSVMAFASPHHGAIVAGLLIAVLLARVLILWGRRDTSDDPIADTFLPLALVVVLLIFFLAPLNIGLYWNLYNRSVLPMTFLAVCLVLPRGQLRSDVWGVLVVLPLLVTLHISRANWTRSLRSWENYAEGFREVMAQAPKQSHLFFIVEHQARTGMRSMLWHHLAQYHTVLNRGTTSYSFGIQPGRIVREAHPLPYDQNKDIGHRNDFRAPERYGCFDVVLQAGQTKAARLYPRRYRVIARKGQWTLYRLSSPSPCRHPSARDTRTPTR